MAKYRRISRGLMDFASVLIWLETLGFITKSAYIAYFERFGFAKKGKLSETETCEAPVYAVRFGFCHLHPHTHRTLLS